jgi:MFS family permease
VDSSSDRASRPSVGSIAATFDVRGYATGFVAMVFLLGYAMGLLLLVPLTDAFEIRRTILTTLIAGAGALILTSLASSALPFLSALVVGVARAPSKC